MSHSCVVVLLTPEEAEDVEGAVERRLAPYEESREVPEYLTPCYCVGHAAREAASDQVRAEFGTLDQMRLRYQAFAVERFPEAGGDYFNLNTPDEFDRWDDMADEFWEPSRRREAELYEQHPRRHEADRGCEECKGTGQYPTTRNPRARWDWYGIGGRWSGHLGDGRNIAPVGEVEWTDERIPFAIVVHPFGWIERGKMGWFGSVSNGTERREWRERARCVLDEAKQRGDVAVVVDVHI